jgi:hypothetical protein
MLPIWIWGVGDVWLGGENAIEILHKTCRLDWKEPQGHAAHCIYPVFT